ncbi:MAG: WD40 repeat domain-containing protein [Bacteroidales bacterium]|jgi:WD40 repeat protein|nr:WD40 repeat domain-containing protein [Bacteroidales bacterium]
MRYKLFITISLSLVIIFVSTKLSNNNKYLIRKYKEHTDKIQSLAFNPNSTNFISGSSDETIKMWELSSTNSLKTLSRHHFDVYALKYCTDGKYFFSGGDKNIDMWDSEGNFIKTFSGNATSIWSIDISKDNKYLVNGCFEKKFRLWDIESEKCIYTFEGHTKSVLATAFSKDGKYIASGSQDYTIKLWDINTKKLIKTINGHGGNIYSLSFSPHNNYLASASRDKTIKIWNAKNGDFIKTLTAHNRSVMDIKFSANGKYMISASYDATVKLWDTKKWEVIYTYKHTDPITSIDISYNNKFIISGSTDNNIYLWELNDNILINYFYKNELKRDMKKSKLFIPKKSTESRKDYKLRQEKAERFIQELYSKYSNKL